MQLVTMVSGAEPQPLPIQALYGVGARPLSPPELLAVGKEARVVFEMWGDRARQLNEIEKIIENLLPADREALYTELLAGGHANLAFIQEIRESIASKEYVWKRPWWHYAAGVGAVGLLAAGGYWLVRRRKRR